VLVVSIKAGLIELDLDVRAGDIRSVHVLADLFLNVLLAAFLEALPGDDRLSTPINSRVGLADGTDAVDSRGCGRRHREDNRENRSAHGRSDSHHVPPPRFHAPRRLAGCPRYPAAGGKRWAPSPFFRRRTAKRVRGSVLTIVFPNYD